ncbi:hypothetical protein AB1484_32315 [Parafrankia sp. FMc6]
MGIAQPVKLSDEDKVALLSGADMWRTKAVPAAGIEPITIW